MPPKKTADVSKAVTADEATPVKESVKDGVNVEVRSAMLFWGRL